MRRAVPLLFLPLAVSLLWAGLPDPAAEKGTWNQPVPEWWQGPVRYALTDPETREYRALSTRAGRAAFIVRFWAARDPNPYAPGNEAEETFWHRVAAADELFSQTTIAGWRTDRGRIYIVLGPPDEIANYPFPSADELDPDAFLDPYYRRHPGELRPGRRGAVQWVYRSLRTSWTQNGQTVTFLRDESGEYRLSGDLPTTLLYEWASGGTEGRSGGQAPGGRRGVPSGAGPGPGGTLPLPTLGDQGSRFEGATPSLDELFVFGQAALFEKAAPPAGGGGGVSTAQYFGVILLQTRLDFFHDSAGTSTLITLGVPSGELEGNGCAARPAEIFGRLETVGDPSHVYQFSSSRGGDSTAPLQEADGRQHRLFEVRGVVPPGEYRVNFGIRVGDRIGSVGDRVTVPDFGGTALRLAGPVLVEQIGGRSSPDPSRGFAVGQLRIVPKLDPAFRSGADFGFYFQVYHALPGPRDGRLHLDIEYGLSIRRKGLFVPLGGPVSLSDNAAPAHAFILPLRGWAAGEYLLTITVTDRVSGGVETGSAVFRVL